MPTTNSHLEGHQPFKAGAPGLAKRIARLKHNQRRPQFSQLSKSRLKRRIALYQRLVSLATTSAQAMNFSIAEGGERREQFSALTALSNQARGRLESAQYHLKEKCWADFQVNHTSDALRATG